MAVTDFLTPFIENCGTTLNLRRLARPRASYPCSPTSRAPSPAQLSRLANQPPSPRATHPHRRASSTLENGVDLSPWPCLNGGSHCLWSPPPQHPWNMDELSLVRLLLLQNKDPEQRNDWNYKLKTSFLGCRGRSEVVLEGCPQFCHSPSFCGWMFYFCDFTFIIQELNEHN